MINSGCPVKKLDEKKFNFHTSPCHENIKRNLLNQSVTFIFNHSSDSESDNDLYYEKSQKLIPNTSMPKKWQKFCVHSI